MFVRKTLSPPAKSDEGLLFAAAANSAAAARIIENDRRGGRNFFGGAIYTVESIRSSTLQQYRTSRELRERWNVDYT